MTDDEVRQTLLRWKENPCQFVWENFRVEPDDWQEDLLNAFASNDREKQRIALIACAGPGKSAGLSWCGWNFISCYGDRDNHPKGAAVSTTWKNLSDNLWPEFSKWQARSPYLTSFFQWNKERIFLKTNPEDWFLSARSWSQTASAEEIGRVLSGLHSKYVLALIDESGDIPLGILRAAEQALSNCVFGKIVQAGNPITHEGMLYAAVTQFAHLWFRIHITGDPEDPKRSKRIDIEWAKEQIKAHGRENPWVMAFILGQFPPSSINSILGPDEVQAAMKRHLPEDQYEWSQKRLGIDVARFGDDRTVIFPRQGLASFKPVIMRQQRTTDIAARVMMAKENFKSEVDLVDDTGHWGHGVIDNLVSAGHSPIGIQFHGPALDPRYKNRRAEMWLKMAEWIRRGGSLPNIPELIGEMTVPTYTFSNGKFQLEDKEQVKARLGRSPDLADALALTFAIPEMPRSIESLAPGAHKKMLADYDPYAPERL